MASNRLLSLDVLRGITIAGMITVNNPGTWAHIYAPLRHAAWNGCTPTDLVFPFFMFVMGVAMTLSYKKFNYELTWKTFGKLLYRSVLLILIGWALGWYGTFIRTLIGGGEFIDAIWNNPVARLRFMGVLPRLGWVSLFGGLCLMAFKPKNTPWVAAVLLVIYCLIIGITGSFDLSPDNIVGRVDLAILGDAHMYHVSTPKECGLCGHPLESIRVAFDPEGILSTIPCIAHCLIGCYAGTLLSKKNERVGKDNSKKKQTSAPNIEPAIKRIALFGAAILMGGFLLDYAFPINKSLWSASYVLVTCGLASLLLALLMEIIDVRGKRRWAVFFESFGVNPLFIFVLAGFLAITLANIKFTFNGDLYSVWSFYYKECMKPLFGETGGSLGSALTFVCLLWGIAHPLYKKHIYIKL